MIQTAGRFGGSEGIPRIRPNTMFHVEHDGIFTGHRLVVPSVVASTPLDVESKVDAPGRLQNRQDEYLGEAVTARTKPASGGWSALSADSNRSPAMK